MPVRNRENIERELSQTALKRSIKNDYYPRLQAYHQNELMRYLDKRNAEFARARKARTTAIDTPEKALAYIEQVKANFRECMGPLHEKGLLRARLIETLDLGYANVDNVLIETLPGLNLAVNFYYPKQAAAPLPGILMFCGHSVRGKVESWYTSFCCEAVRQGMCVATFDPVGQGERFYYDGEDHPMFEKISPDDVHFLLGQQLLLGGETITRYMMHDNVRALDYLLSRPEVDSSRIGVTGNSGGGHMSAFMGAYDDRISAIAPCSYMTELSTLAYFIGVQESEQSIPNFMKYGLNLADLAIAAAPKPYYVGGNLFDFFPVEGLRDAMIDIQRVYNLLGPENLDYRISPTTHGWWTHLREGALRFFCRHFGVEYDQRAADELFDVPEEAAVYVTEERDVRAVDSTTLLEYAIENARPKFKPLASEGSAALRDELCGQLREMLDIDVLAEPQMIESLGREQGAAFISEDFAFDSEPDMRVYATLYKKTDTDVSNALIVSVRGEGAARAEALKYLAEFDAVMTVEVRGEGRGTMQPHSWFFPPQNTFTEEATYACNALLWGRTLLGMRVQDTLCAVRLFKKVHPDTRVTLGGEAENGVYALIAALYTPGAGLRARGLLRSLREVYETRIYDWNPAMFAPELALKTDIPELLAALCDRDVRVDGFLDAKKRPVQ